MKMMKMKMKMMKMKMKTVMKKRDDVSIKALIMKM